MTNLYCINEGRAKRIVHWAIPSDQKEIWVPVVLDGYVARRLRGPIYEAPSAEDAERRHAEAGRRADERIAAQEKSLADLRSAGLSTKVAGGLARNGIGLAGIDAVTEKQVLSIRFQGKRAWDEVAALQSRRKGGTP